MGKMIRPDREIHGLPSLESKHISDGDSDNNANKIRYHQIESRINPAKLSYESKLFNDDGTPKINQILLRDSCRCSLCIDGSTLQRKFVTAHIPADIQGIFKGRSNRGRVKVGWKNDIPGYPRDHQSVYSQEYLRQLTSPAPASPVARPRLRWDKASFEKRASWTKYDDFVNDTSAYKCAMSALHRDGLIFITDAPSDPNSVATMANRLGPIRNTFYGSTWDVKSVSDSKNVAYTNQHLGFHMDLLYMANPPGYQLLHCLKNSCAGGESRFADTFQAARLLRLNGRRYYDMLRQYKVEWVYENDGQSYRQRRATIQEAARFVGSEENARRRMKFAALGRDFRGEVEQAELAYVNWSPPFQGMLYYNAEHPERLDLFLEASKEFDRILNSEDMVVELKMEEGTCAIFENRRIVHARNAFDVGDGERWLRGAYVDEDAFWSRCRVIGADQYDTDGVAVPENIVRTYPMPSPVDVGSDDLARRAGGQS
jgi:Taurine catabolism dioxygenase TauD, TfdA family